LIVRPEVSQVTGYVEDYPIVASRSMDVSCMVESGSWVVLAGLDDWRSTAERRGFGGLYAMDTEGAGSVVLMLRADRVGFGGLEVLGVEVEQ
jgi:hypothetical protein